MTQHRNDQLPANGALREPEPNVIDQRQQQIDPAGRHRKDPNARPDGNRKQPGGSPHDGRGARDAGARTADKDNRP